MGTANENNGTWHNTKGKIAEAHGRMNEAEDEYQEALINDPKPENIDDYERVTNAGAGKVKDN
jgi:tetratricopeptide (TPR) repeat protein